VAYIEDGFSVEKQENKDNKKEILWIGDSIRLGCCHTTKEDLKDEYLVAFPDDNCRNTQYILTSLFSWVELVHQEKTALVVFNAGHWDTAHWDNDALPLTSKEEYAKNIGLIIDRIHRIFPDSKVLFYTTSRMNPLKVGRNPRDNETIAVYNGIAKAVCQDKGVAILDVFDYCKKYTNEDYVDYAHLTDAAFEDLGHFFAKSFRDFLA